MKQIIAIFIVLGFFLIPEAAFSQSGLILGARGGASLSTLKVTGDLYNSDASRSRMLRYRGGVDVGFQFGSISLLSGARYVMYGAKTAENRDDPNGKAWVDEYGNIDVGERKLTNKFNTISIPVLARYRTGKGPVRVGIALGPQFNMGMGKLTIAYEDVFTNNPGTYEYTYDFGKASDNILKKSSVSFVFMPEVAFEVNPRGVFKVNLVLESSGDLLNKSYLVNSPNGARKVQGSVKSNAFAVEVGYEHRLEFNVGVKY